MEHDERHRANDLDRHWDAVLRGDPILPPAESAADLTELVERLHAAAAIPPLFPNPQRAWLDLRRRTTEEVWIPDTPPTAMTDVTPSGVYPNGRVPASLGCWPTAHRRVPRSTRRWALAQLATAALLVLTLAAGYVAVRQTRQVKTNDPFAAVGGETLFAATFAVDELPAGEVVSIFYRLTLPPGASLPSLAGPSCRCAGDAVAAGVGVETVQAGRYGLRLAAPIRVRRGGASGGEEAIPAESEVTLGPGDVAVYPDYAAAGEVHNAGTEPVVLVGMAIVGTDGSGTPAPKLPAGVRGEELALAIPTDWQKLPAGPVTVTLWRLTLPPGASVPPYEPAGLEAMRVEAGTIAWNTLRPGEDVSSRTPLYRMAGTTVPFVGTQPGVKRVVANAGDTPAVLLVVRIEPAGIGPTSLAS